MGCETYVWRVEGKPVEVHLRLSAMDRMKVLAPEAFGMLMGRSEKRRGGIVTVVEDFEPLPNLRVRDRLRRPDGCKSNVVGLYRSRPGGALRLDGWDARAIESAFRGSGMVYLLIQPESGGPARATFFIQESGAVHGYGSYVEFQWDAERLRAAGAVEDAPANGRNGIGWIPAGSAAAVVAGVAGFLWWPASSGVDAATGSPAPVERVASPAPVRADARGDASAGPATVRSRPAKRGSQPAGPRGRKPLHARRVTAPRVNTSEWTGKVADSDSAEDRAQASRSGRFRRILSKIRALTSRNHSR